MADYERELRRALKSRPDQSNGTIPEVDKTASLLDKINDLIASASSALSTAESKQWNLLICALGAELEALEQGRALLGGKQAEPPSLQRIETNGTSAEDDPPPDLLHDSTMQRSNSNQSLQDTLREFGVGDGDGTVEKGKSPVRNDAIGAEDDAAVRQDPWAPALGNAFAGGSGSRSRGGREYRSESEDDEPGLDFLVEHS